MKIRGRLTLVEIRFLTILKPKVKMPKSCYVNRPCILRYGERATEDKKERNSVKHELGKYGVSQQMKLEQAERKRIEDMKENERKRATKELQKWKESQRQLTEAATTTVSQTTVE